MGDVDLAARRRSLVLINSKGRMYSTFKLNNLSSGLSNNHSIYCIEVIDNIVLNLLSQLDILLVSINDLFIENKYFKYPSSNILLPLYREISGSLTFVYPGLESVINYIEDNKLKSTQIEKNIQFKYLYLTLSIMAYIHNTSLEIGDLLCIKGKLISQNY